jgi:long-chain acyl-CoA synthetase
MATASILRTFADIEPGSRMACWLPLSNLFQRMLNFCAIARGAQIYYVPQPQEIMRHVAAIRPEVFIGVPRFYEKLYAGIVDQIDGMPGPRRRAALWCLRVGSRYRNDLRSARGAGIALRLTYALADRLVLRHIRGVMGTNLRYMISGSAPMPRWLLERFEAIGWRVFEAYGLSENVIPVAANSPAAHRLGTVGQVMPGNEVRLAGDGELWVRGPGVCTGYLGDEAASPPADVEGFLATGDYATIDADRFVTLTGRKSDIFKTSTGRRIAPAAVEAALRAIPYVEHAVLFGSGRPFAVAILAVSGGRLRGSTTVGGASSLVDSRDAIVADVRRVLAAFPDYQRPSGLLVTTRAFGIDSGELTANLKLRRQGIAERFASALDELYALLEASKGASAMRVVEDGTTLLCNV